MHHVDFGHNEAWVAYAFQSAPSAESCELEPDRNGAVDFAVAVQMKVGIQGIRGAFHEEAALKWFGDGLVLHPCRDFPDLLDDLLEGKCDRAVMALENTISGTMQRNLRLLGSRELRIVGEVRMPIIQNLGALPGVTTESLKEVRSHHMALNQCRHFFQPYAGIRLVNDEDTAVAAKLIKDNHWQHVGCIASARALEIYGLQCLGSDIADDSANLTRFLVIERGRTGSIPTGANLATATLVLPHQTGSLNAALSILFRHEISLSKVESMPLLGRPYAYEFVMDLEGADADCLLSGLEELGRYAEALSLLGIYRRDITAKS